MKDEHSRETYHEAFVRAVNIIEPSHCHYDGTHERLDKDAPDDLWPMTRDELDASYKRSDGYACASAGPRSTRGNKAGFAIDLSYFNERSVARCMAVIVHEVTHISVGGYTDVEHGSHPPRFWDTMCEYANRLWPRIHELEELFGEPIEKDELIAKMAADPNENMVDRRRETVAERRQKMRDRLDFERDARPETDVQREIAAIQQTVRENFETVEL